MRGPGTPPQAGATASPAPAPLPMATKQRRKRAAFPHLSAAELLVHPVFGTHANIGKPHRLPYEQFSAGKFDQLSSAEVAAQAAAAASQPSAYYVFPAGTNGGPPLPPLRLLRSNAAGFGDVNAGLDLPKPNNRAAHLSSDAAGHGSGDVGSPALAARARAQQTSACHPSSVKVQSCYHFERRSLTDFDPQNERSSVTVPDLAWWVRIALLSLWLYLLASQVKRCAAVACGILPCL